jgi:Cu/Zn superoxide dismutase
MKLLRFALLGTALAGILATAAAADAPTTVTIKMLAQNNSGETGTAVLTQTSAGLKVEVALDGAPTDTPQPTHIHVGTCANLNKAPKYPLTNTVNGKSTTTLSSVKLSDLLASPFAINVHKSGTDLATYVSCGDITAS